MLKKLTIACVTAIVMGLTANTVFAAAVGTVNLDKILNSYYKAQDVATEIKIKDADLQKFLVDAQKQLKDAKSPVEKKNLEQKLADKYKSMAKKLDEYKISQWKEIEDDIFKAIEDTAKQKNYEVVLAKSVVLLGGEDITDQVMAILNKSKK